MLVDSYRFLPRSFIPLYENPGRLEGEDQPILTPFTPRLADATIALLSSAGLSLSGDQAPFDLDGERANPMWGDPSYRVLPQAMAGRSLTMSHLHVNPADILADHNVALPTDRLDELVAAGRVGHAAPQHLSVMGYQEAGLAAWRNETAPAIVELLRSQGADGVVLAPV